MLDVHIAGKRGSFALDVAFRAGAGVTALFGRSGAGKTSVVDSIAGLVKPERGRIVVDERVLFDRDAGIDLAPERRRVGYVFQEPRLFPHLSVRSNLLFGTRFQSSAGTVVAEFDHVVDLLGLKDLLARRPGRLSGGEQQRVAIGRALLAKPALLLMDEPLASLDAARKAEILPYIERLRDDFALPVVYVSHALDEVVRLADMVVLMSDGRVVATGAVDDVLTRLDLRPLTGRYEFGAVIDATVAGHDQAYGLTRLVFGPKDDPRTLFAPEVALPEGEAVRVRVRARDVTVATRRPEDVSSLNILPGRIVEVSTYDGPFVELRVDAGAVLTARVTRKSFDELGLAAGREVFLLIKTVALDRRALGRLNRG